MQSRATLRLSLVMPLLAIGFADTKLLAQGCNPAIDGTYCASAGIQDTPGGTLPFTATPSYSISGMAGPGYGDSPATFSAITFGTDGSRCIGFFRRSNCRN